MIIIIVVVVVVVGGGGGGGDIKIDLCIAYIQRFEGLKGEWRRMSLHSFPR